MKLFLRAALWTAATMIVYGQSAQIAGRITDTSGAVMPKVRVNVTNEKTGVARNTQSNNEGYYSVPLLQPGTYRLLVQADGFKPSSRDAVVLTVDQVARIDFVLEVGNVTEAITVGEDAPLVNVTNASVGRTVDNAEITQLPIVGRNVYTLLTLTPGVESSANSNVLGYPEQRTMINGGANGGVGSVNYFLDGGTNMTGLRNTGNIAPNPDAVQEFRVITNSYSAEYGRFAGGVINILTKSGTNQLHGSLFEFLRNDKLNANTWQSLSRPPLRRNQFGGSIGGPIRKDRTFFFGTYSGLRENTTTFLNSAVVPTEAERSGDFTSSKSSAPVDPLTKQPFPDKKIPLSRFDTTAANILAQSIPLANSSGNVYQAQVPSPYDTNEFLAKLDHTLTTRHQLSGSYYYTSGKNRVHPTGTLPWSIKQFSWRQQNVNASDTWMVSPSTVNQFWVSYTRNMGGRLNLPAKSLADFGSNFRIQGEPSLPQITVNSYFTLGQSIAGPVAGTNYYSVRNSLNHTHGRHSFKFGGEVALGKDIQQTLLNNYGVFSFDGSKAGSGLADFLLGLPRTMNQDAPVTALDNTWMFGFFAQDDFRVSSRLTLNLGLRWDIQTPPTDPFDRESTFIQGVQSTVIPSAPTGMLFPGDPGITRGIVPVRWRNFSPRVGLAWDPFGGGKTSLRAAAGVFYGSVSGNEWNSTSNYVPFAVRQQFNDVATLTDPYRNLPGGVSPFPFTYSSKSPKFLYPATIWGIAPDFVWPYTYQFNLSVQQEVARDFSVTAAYVGSLSRRLPFAVDVNYPIYKTGATSSNVNDRRPILPGTLSSVSAVRSIMNASYHGLQTTMEKRFSHRIAFKGFYTFSKSLSGAQLHNDTTGGGAHNYRNLALEKGRSDFDRRHACVTSLIWQPDYFAGTGRILSNVLNGWELSAIVTLRSGTPLTISSGKDNNLDGTNNDRASVVGNPFLDPNRSRAEASALWFNTAAFVTNPTGMEGTSGRNIITSPGTRNVDLGLFRNFKIYERLRLQARAEMTNAFNLVSLSAPSATLTSGTFGQVRSASGMREAQMGLRLIF